MASKSHQMIAGLIVRKMREKGFRIVSFDGDEALINCTPLKIPPRVGRHRPDVIGVDLKSKRICIGEAKTPQDLDSKRTKEQLRDYAYLITDFKSRFEFIIGIQKSSENKVKRILRELGIENSKDVSYVWIPEELLENEED